jgi:hypothetical protein
MPVTAIPIVTRLVLRLNTGLDENFNPVYRNRTWSNIKPSSSITDLHELAQEMAVLQVHTLESVRKVDENELEES